MGGWPVRFLCLGTEIQHHAIDAPALARGWWSVLEDVAHMQAAGGAVAFSAGQDHLEIGLGGDRVWRDWLPIARPARAGIEFVLR